MKNPKVGKVKMSKQTTYHVTAPMSGQFLKSRDARDERSDLDFKNCPDIGAVTW